MSKTSKQYPTVIKAQRNRLGEAAVNWLVLGSLRRAFSQVRLKVEVGAEAPRPQARLDRPAIFYLNHSSWWDGYVTYLLARHLLKADAYLMMDVRQLRKYFFFTWAGAFSVDRQNTRSAVESLNYISNLLRERRWRSLWLFPQGEIQTSSRRPLDFFGGHAAVARKLPTCYLYPVAVRYEFATSQFPEIFMRIGPGQTVQGGALNAKALTNDTRLRLEQQLEQMNAELNAGRYSSPAAEVENFPGYRTILRGKGSANSRFEKIFGPLLPKQGPASKL